MRRVYERRRERQGLSVLARSHEAAGDAALKRFAYVEAVEQFERAFKQNASVKDEARLCVKIGHSLKYSARPDLARPWYERALERFLSLDAKHSQIARVLVSLAAQCGFEHRHQEAFTYLERLSQFIESTRATSSVQFDENEISSWPHLLKASWFAAQGRHTETQHELSLNGEVPATVRGPHQEYLFEQGALLAAQGCTQEAFTTFDRCAMLCAQFSQGLGITSLWATYSSWAMELGHIDIARTCRERALFVARERRVAWRIPHALLRLIALLITTGDYQQARDFLANAMTYETKTPSLHLLQTVSAMRLANILGDTELLKRTFDEEVLECSIRSGDPIITGMVISTFVKVAIMRRQLQQAKNLISRGVATIHDDNRADHVGELLALAAQYGTPADAHRARYLLEARLQLPNHQVAQAYLHLWEAHAALARRTKNEARVPVEQAAVLFAQLGWRHQETEALALIGKLPSATRVQNGSIGSAPVLGNFQQALTKREQQVAELVLQGLTNRGIAHTLSISEHTVESHVASILERFGLRSRWQLMHVSP